MIGNSIYALLMANPVVDTYVSDRIYPVQAPQRDMGNLIIYGIAGTKPEETKQGPSKEDWVMVDIVVYSKDYDEMHTIAKAVREALDYQNGTIAGNEISNIVFEDYSDSWQTDRECYEGLLQFTVISKP
ncbi:DUF3168 domain-containing protein [Echinicola strongylocentroti]|nr:DUF3168 domain-containing protein [Echinicola strongylocentroti]